MLKLKYAVRYSKTSGYKKSLYDAMFAIGERLPTYIQRKAQAKKRYEEEAVKKFRKLTDLTKP